ncbi:MAG: alpha/beta hydrolase [Burkholderiaceae bacterium]|nr:alpha/beta hydrolase [Burkholderiaceae bacterium]
MGGYVAFELLRQHPERLLSLALSELVRSMAGSIALDGLIAQQEAMPARPDSPADLARVSCPSLVMVGRQNQVTPIADHLAMVEHIRRQRADCRFEIIEDCGHLSTVEQPAATSQLLRNWLKP